MQALLVRVGIDSSDKSGNWNAPVNPETGEFAYVPILETGGKNGEKKIRLGYEKISYEQFKVPCGKLGRELHSKFDDKPAHLDPDFRHLTYGDEDNKAAQLRNLKLVEGDILAFYAGLKPPNAGPGELVHALIGLYVLACEPKRALDIRNKEDWGKNAHTRREPGEDDIVFFGKKGDSGRLERCIDIGEYRNGYYLKSELWEKWGGLRGSDWIQRGPHRSLLNPERFYYEWFKKQNIPLLQQNN